MEIKNFEQFILEDYMNLREENERLKNENIKLNLLNNGFPLEYYEISSGEWRLNEDNVDEILKAAKKEDFETLRKNYFFVDACRCSFINEYFKNYIIVIVSGSDHCLKVDTKLVDNKMVFLNREDAVSHLIDYVIEVASEKKKKLEERKEVAS